MDTSIRFGAPPDARILARKAATKRRVLSTASSYLAERVRALEPYALPIIGAKMNREPPHGESGLSKMSTLILNATYAIELCSGEQRLWRYRGPDERGAIWWQDVESDREFTETSLMYAWKVIGRGGQNPAN
jgi:hypothetical protein